MHAIIRNALLAIGLLALSAVGPEAQSSVARPTAVDIIATLGDAVGAGGMVARTIGSQLASSPTPRTVFVLGEQILPEWLPLLDHTNYIVLNADEGRAHVAACGEYLFVHTVSRESDRATVAVGRGNRCQSGGIVKSFRHVSSGWDEDGGVSGGFGGGTAHCGCNSGASK